MSGRPKLHSVFVSDLHLGYKGADIRSLNDFLRSHDYRHLYLVGDIFDGWKLEQRWYWSQDYSDFLDLLIDLSKRGVKIALLTGNHDEELRGRIARILRPALLKRFGIEVDESVEHRGRDGRRYLIMHGDQFDSRLIRDVSRRADDVWSKIEAMSWMQAGSDVGGKAGKQRPWSLGKAIATNAKSLIWSYAQAAARHAARSGMDGIVCGHSHVPALETRGQQLFANCGSWTSGHGPGGCHTAIVEHHDGRFELMKWPSRRLLPTDRRLQTLSPAEPNTRHRDAAILAWLVYRLWKPKRIDGRVPSGPAWASQASAIATRH